MRIPRPIREGDAAIVVMSAQLKLEPARASAAQRKAHVVVFGNEKGGTGKTTTAMHIAIALVRMGKSVATIDLDGRQRTFARYIENRAAFVKRSGSDLPMPTAEVVTRSTSR